jgi:hypothetical protein
VISWGRGILEGMACGRAVLSFDKRAGDGYLTAAKYFESREHNFGPVGCTNTNVTVEDLVREIEQYTTSAMAVNRALAVAYHSHIHGTDDVLASIDKVLK